MSRAWGESDRSAPESGVDLPRPIRRVNPIAKEPPL
jgi:hypothetical protein